MSITLKEVQRIAQLAHLEFSQEELEKFIPQFQRILDYFEQLRKVETKTVEPTYHVLLEILEEGVTREDAVHPSLSSEKVLKAAPGTRRGFFQVPRVIE